jgi:competence protein ComGC
MNKKILFLIVILEGSIFLFITVPAIIKSSNLKNHGVTTESTVLSSKRQSSSKGTSTYMVTVTFNTPDGNTITATARKRHSDYMDTSFIPKGNNTIG